MITGGDEVDFLKDVQVGKQRKAVGELGGFTSLDKNFEDFDILRACVLAAGEFL